MTVIVHIPGDAGAVAVGADRVAAELAGLASAYRASGGLAGPERALALEPSGLPLHEPGDLPRPEARALRDAE